MIHIIIHCTLCSSTKNSFFWRCEVPTRILRRFGLRSVPVWRPMWADRLKENVYRIKSFSDFDPDDELEFKTGEVVLCERQLKSEQHCLVATKKMNND